MRICISLITVLLLAACSSPKADLVIVEKSKNKMHLINDGRTMKSYDISLGQNPVGPKMMRGDMRTPEGTYMIDYKNENSKFYRSLNISYPNEFDVARAQSLGIDPGDDIVIHGLPNGINDNDPAVKRKAKNWTQGCIAVRNAEMDEIWRLVEVDTPIEIRP